MNTVKPCSQCKYMKKPWLLSSELSMCNHPSRFSVNLVTGKLARNEELQYCENIRKWENDCSMFQPK